MVLQHLDNSEDARARKARLADAGRKEIREFDVLPSVAHDGPSFQPQTTFWEMG